jgi:hypothetical protein
MAGTHTLVFCQIELHFPGMSCHAVDAHLVSNSEVVGILLDVD